MKSTIIRMTALVAVFMGLSLSAYDTPYCEDSEKISDQGIIRTLHGYSMISSEDAEQYGIPYRGRDNYNEHYDDYSGFWGRPAYDDINDFDGYYNN